MELKMPAKKKEGAGTFSPTERRGQWSRANGHPHHPSPRSESPTRPSGSIVPKTTLRTALENPQLLGGAIPGDSWHGWRSLLLAAMGEALRPEELATYRSLTERERPPTERVSELVAVVGRRGGKSRAIAALLCYLGLSGGLPPAAG